MYGVFFVLLCIACIQDIRTGKISNLLVAAFAVTGGFYSHFSGDWYGVLNWLAQVLVYMAVLYPLYKMGALGAGDVKMMAVAEGVFGWKEGISYFICVWLLAGLIALVKMLSQGNFVERMEYFFSYVVDMTAMGKWQFYHKEREQASQRDRAMCMSVPLLVGFVLCMGG